MIEVRNLSKSYGDKMVVHDVSLKIQKGKITSLIGPNGAGKSTAFSMIQLENLLVLVDFHIARENYKQKILNM